MFALRSSNWSELTITSTRLKSVQEIPGIRGPEPGKPYEGVSTKCVRSRTETGSTVKGTSTFAAEGPNWTWMAADRVGGVPSSKSPTVRSWTGSVKNTSMEVSGSTPVSPPPGRITGCCSAPETRTSGGMTSSPTVEDATPSSATARPDVERTPLVIRIWIWNPVGNISCWVRSPSESTTKTNVLGWTSTFDPAKDPPASVPGKPSPGASPFTSSATGFPFASGPTQASSRSWLGFAGSGEP